MGARAWIPEALLWRARAFQAQGRLAEAREDLATAVALARPPKLRRVLRHLLMDLAVVEAQLEHNDESEAVLAEARALTRRMADRLWPDELRLRFPSQPKVRDLVAAPKIDPAAAAS